MLWLEWLSVLLLLLPGLSHAGVERAVYTHQDLTRRISSGFYVVGVRNCRLGCRTAEHGSVSSIAQQHNPFPRHCAGDLTAGG